MNKNITFQLLPMAIAFLLYNSCSKNSETINIRTDKYTITANVLKDSIAINDKKDTIHILNGLYIYSDSLVKIRGEFSKGVLDGVFSIEQKSSKYEGRFVKNNGSQTAKDVFLSYFNYNPSKSIDKRFSSELGTPDGKHVVWVKDYKMDKKTFTGNIREAYFSSGLPDKTWKQHLYDDIWEEIEFINGTKIKSKKTKNQLVISETFYKNGSEFEELDYEYDENSNLIKKKIFNYESLKSITEHYDNNGILLKKIMDGKEYIYEAGIVVGVVVKEFITSYPYFFGLRAMDIPKGKMWTPLYYEVTKAPSGRYKPPFLYPKAIYSTDTYLTKEGIPFPEKSDFVSYKVSKQTYKPLTSEKNFAIAAGSWEIGENHFSLYFLEEDAN